MKRRVRRLARRVMGFLAGRSIRTALMAAATMVAAGAVAWLWERGPNLAPDTRDGLSPAEQIQAVGQYHTTLIQASAAVGGVIALGYTARNYRLSRRGQTTDRFTKALERLGSTDLYVRLGAVYALEQVLRDSPELQADVVNVLVAFVRAHTRFTASTKVHRERTTHQGTHAVVLSVLPDQLDHPERPHADIQAALTVLGRLPHLPTVPLDLTHLHLAGAQLAGANLTRAWFAGTDLSHAFIVGTNLTHAWLRRVNLTRAWLDSANLAGAQLDWANLTGAKLDRANLTDARLHRANLTGAWITGTRLDRANLTRARLRHAVLSDSRFDEANLTGTQLDGAILANSRFDGANLTDTKLPTPSGITSSRKSQGL